MDGLDVDALREAGRKIVAVEADTLELDPIALDLDRRSRKLDVDALGRRLRLAGPVPQVGAGDVILGRAIYSHFLKNDQCSAGSAGVT